jgi:hypothetical protein
VNDKECLDLRKVLNVALDFNKIKDKGVIALSKAIEASKEKGSSLKYLSLCTLQTTSRLQSYRR